MTKRVVCTECGREFVVTDLDGVFTPPNCPGCDKLVLEIKTSPTSDELSAQVEE